MLFLSRKNFMKKHMVMWKDPYFDKVALLLHMDGNDGSTTITDVKGNLVTNVNGVALTSTNKKYGTTSADFGSTSNKRLDLPTALGALWSSASGDFTLEAWTYCTSVGYNTLFSFGSVGGLYIYNERFTLYVGSSATAESYVISGAQSAAGSVPNNQWNHIVLERQGNAYRGFVNGVEVLTTTNASAIPTPAEVTLGSWRSFNNPNGVNQFQGKIDEVRYTKGLARYTTNFTPSPKSFPDTDGIITRDDAYWDKVSLLLNMDGTRNSTTISDEKGHLFSSIVYGGEQAKITNVPTKFGTGSLSVKQKTDTSEAGIYIETPDAPDLRLTGDFTVECFLYPLSLDQNSFIFAKGTGNFCQFSANAIYLNGGGISIFSGNALNLDMNAWNHLAITRQGNTWRVFANGVQKAMVTNTNVFGNNASAFRIGNDGFSSSLPFHGNIDEFRLTKDVARYVTNFPPPIKAFGVGKANEYFFRFNGASGSNLFTEDTGLVITSIVGTPVISTAQFKSGNSSVLFNGSSGIMFDPVTLAGDFTVETWIYEQDRQLAYMPIVCSGIGGYMCPLILNYDGGGFAAGYLGYYLPGGGVSSTGVSVFSSNQWQHVAAVREGLEYRMYVNGERVLTRTLTAISSIPIDSIGRWTVNGVAFKGFVDDVCINNGKAKYNANFVPVIP